MRREATKPATLTSVAHQQRSPASLTSEATKRATLTSNASDAHQRREQRSPATLTSEASDAHQQRSPASLAGLLNAHQPRSEARRATPATLKKSGKNRIENQVSQNNRWQCIGEKRCK